MYSILRRPETKIIVISMRFVLILLRFFGFQQVGVMTLGDVGMGPQPPLHVVQSNLAEQWVLRIVFGAMGLGGERWGQMQKRHGGVEAGSEEKRGGYSFDAGGRRDHAMHGGAQVAVGGEFQQLADVDDEGAGAGRHVDPASWSFDLEASWVVLQQQGNQSGVLVGADALARTDGGVVPRIADELYQIMRVVAVQRFEGVGGLAERQRKRAQQPREHLHGGGLPADDHRTQLRQRDGPLIRASQPRPYG